MRTLRRPAVRRGMRDGGSVFGGMKTRVLFLSQQRLIRESLAGNLAQAAAIDLLPPVTTTEEAIALMQSQHPAVIVVDLNPSLFGLRVARELQASCPECAIIMLVSHSDRIAEIQLTLAGVKGVLNKNIGIQDLISAIEQVSAGKTILTEEDRVVAKQVKDNKSSGLTGREAEVLELVAKGLANKQIAAELGISIKTVEKHRQRVMCKLNAHETAGLTWRAICMGVARDGAAYRYMS